MSLIGYSFRNEKTIPPDGSCVTGHPDSNQCLVWRQELMARMVCNLPRNLEHTSGSLSRFPTCPTARRQ
jgi:hypothetical protein